MIVLLNGAFGIGKTAVAQALVARLPDSLLFDPEITGLLQQRTARLLGQHVEDFQDLPSWRRLTVLGVRIARMLRTNVIVPMAFSNASYLDEVRTGIARFDPSLFHFCLVAPADVVQERLRTRGADPHTAAGAWQYRRASECCAVHGSDVFSQHVSAAAGGPEQIAQEVLAQLAARHVST